MLNQYCWSVHLVEKYKNNTLSFRTTFLLTILTIWATLLYPVACPLLRGPNLSFTIFLLLLFFTCMPCSYYCLKNEKQMLIHQFIRIHS